MGLPGLEGLPGAKVSNYWSRELSHLPQPNQIANRGKVPSQCLELDIQLKTTGYKMPDNVKIKRSIFSCGYESA